MMRGDTSSWDRRRVLKLTGVSVVGATAFSQTGTADEEDADVSVRFNDQESDGTSVVIESLYSEVEAEVIIFHSEGDRKRYRVLDVEAGTEFSDRTIELDEPIPETQLISVSIQPPQGAYSYGGDRATVAVGGALDDSGPTVELIEADPDSGFHLPYALFKPEIQQNTERPIYVQPNNAGRVETYDELKAQIKGSGFRAPSELQYFGLIPGLPRLPADGLDLVQTLAIQTLQPETGLDAITTDAFPEETLERVNEQIVNMIDDATERLENDGYNVSEQVHMGGYSGSGTFTSRFALLHPDQVSTISFGGTGAVPLPHDTLEGTRLPYPLGTADYEDIMGKEFDKQEWLDVDQFFFNGQEDQPLPETDPGGYHGISMRYEDRAVDVFGKNRVTERHPTIISVYEGAGASVSSNIYEGVGHLVNSDMLDDTVAFHRENSTAQHALFDLSTRKSATSLATEELVTVTVDIENQVSRDATATPTLSVDDQQITTIETDVPAGESETIEFEHSFDTPGSYQLRVNGLSVGEPIEIVEQPTSDEEVNDSPTADSEPSEESTDPDDVSTEDQPGFGIAQSIAALGGLGYLIKLRISDGEE